MHPPLEEHERPRVGLRTAGGPAVGPGRLLAAAVSLALVAGACGDGEPAEDEEGRTTAILRARTQGLNHLEQDRLDDAEAQFRRLTELAPDRSAGPAHLALVALRRGEGEAAEEHARTALRRAPEDAWLHLVLAKALEMQGRAEEARAERERALELHPGNLRALWALAGGSPAEERGAPRGDTLRADHLARILEEAPASLPARLALTEARLAEGRARAAAAQLEDLRSLISEYPDGAEAALEAALERARAGDAEGARRSARRLHRRMRTTPAYQGDLAELAGPRGEATGFARLSFSHELSTEVPDEEAVLEAMRFVDATDVAGLASVGRTGEASGPGAGPAGAAPVVAVGDVDGDGDGDLYVWDAAPGQGGKGRLLLDDQGAFSDAAPEAVAEAGRVRAATFADVDGNGYPDLYLVREGPDRLFRNEGGGELVEVSGEAAVARERPGDAVLFADLDHDGDLDLLVGSAAGVEVHRNDGDGTFTELPGRMGMDAVEGPVRDLDFADVDGDADLDIVAARGDGGVELLVNRRQGRFEAVAGSAGLADAPPADAVAVGDYDNDGHPDLAVSAADGGAALFRNGGDGRFERDRRSEDALSEGEGGGADAAFVDVDNDGRLDLVLGGGEDGEGVRVLHNEGEGIFDDLSSRLLPDGRPRARRLAAFDYNGDGDRDLLASSVTGLRLLRNDGGDANHHVELRLKGRGSGSGKVNRFGIGSRVDVRAGDLYQSRTVRGAETQFGLGHRLKADVVRIVWTNGVPQHLHFPGTDQDLVEQQTLKGSCAFVYAWNGEGYEFVTDAMWRSALGMPVGIMGERSRDEPPAGGPASEGRAEGGDGPGPAGAGRTYAPPGASREYVRIAPDQLELRSGRYRLQLTEELWEVAYVDEVRLLTVDHPDSVEIFVDESFVPPAPPELRLFRVDERLRPVSARDGDGDDVLPLLRARDHRYVSDLAPGAHQGIVEPHEIVLEVPREAVRAERSHLFLRGWVFPTDASINVAVAQSDSLAVRPPRLAVPDGDGGWRPVKPAGFPSGKDKTVVVDVSGVVPADDPRVRIRTNMQVYWDQAFFAVDAVGPAAEGGAEEAVARWGASSGDVHLLRPVEADLHERGFSREYRRGGRHGPHWFDHDDVSRRSPWLAIPGRYTRYGDVLPLLGDADDRYVVMGPGDGMAVAFDASGVPEPPARTTRTFLLYTDGWIKDADLNTAGGDAVAPLPFHGQSRYPPAADEGYPRDSAHRAYLERYQTRVVPGPAVSPLAGDP